MNSEVKKQLYRDTCVYEKYDLGLITPDTNNLDAYSSIYLYESSEPVEYRSDEARVAINTELQSINIIGTTEEIPDNSTFTVNNNNIFDELGTLYDSCSDLLKDAINNIPQDIIDFESNVYETVKMMTKRISNTNNNESSLYKKQSLLLFETTKINKYENKDILVLSNNNEIIDVINMPYNKFGRLVDIDNGTTKYYLYIPGFCMENNSASLVFCIDGDEGTETIMPDVVLTALDLWEDIPDEEK